MQIMLLVIDIGNTNLKMGAFEGAKLLGSWRLGTSLSQTSDEYGETILNLLRRGGFEARRVDAAVISSVIPPLNHTLLRVCEYYFNVKPVFISAANCPMPIKYDNPRELGADRIVNSYAAYRLYGAPCISIDFGTATTFNVVGHGGEFLGGLICWGIKTSADALIQSAAQLHKFEFDAPKTFVNTSTLTNMQAGTVLGTVGMAEYICGGIIREQGFKECKVIASGGFSELIAGSTGAIDIVDKLLTLKGLQMIYEELRSKEKTV